MVITEMSLETYANLYYDVAVFGTIFFIVKMIIFSVLGGDSEVIADFNTEIDTDASFNFISVQALLAFMMGFGWMGLAGVTQFKMYQLESMMWALGVGFIFFFVTTYLMFLTKKLEKKVVKNKRTAIGKSAKAYINIAPHSEGQIEVEVNGQLTICKAFNTTDVEIKAFEVVEVVDVKDDVLYVEIK